MTAIHDFFRFIKLYSADGNTVEFNIEADAVTDSLHVKRGQGVKWTGGDVSTDTFTIDVQYDLDVPLGTTNINLTDVNTNTSTIQLTQAGGIQLTRLGANNIQVSSFAVAENDSLHSVAKRGSITTEKLFIEDVEIGDITSAGSDGFATIPANLQGSGTIDNPIGLVPSVRSVSSAAASQQYEIVTQAGTGLFSYSAGYLIKNGASMSVTVEREVPGAPGTYTTLATENGNTVDVPYQVSANYSETTATGQKYRITYTWSGNGGTIDLDLKLTYELYGVTANPVLTTNSAGGSITTRNILPASGNTFDIGSTTDPFRDIYATEFHGAFKGTLDGDFTGSVFGDDSTLLVDAVNSKIVGPVLNSSVITTGLTVNGAGAVTGNLEVGTLSDGTANINSGVGVGFNSISSNVFVGDLRGSVSADDSTVIIDGANGKILSPSVEGHLTMRDDDKIKLGDGPDLEIYHNGTDSYIDDVGTGSLFIRSGTTYFQNAAGSKTSIQTNAGAGQTINFNNSPRLATTSDGIAVTGNVTAAEYYGDFKGSLFGDDSSIIVDSIANKISIDDLEMSPANLSGGNGKGLWLYASNGSNTQPLANIGYVKWGQKFQSGTTATFSTNNDPYGSLSISGVGYGAGSGINIGAFGTNTQGNNLDFYKGRGNSGITFTNASPGDEIANIRALAYSAGDFVERAKLQFKLASSDATKGVFEFYNGTNLLLSSDANNNILVANELTTNGITRKILSNNVSSGDYDIDVTSQFGDEVFWTTPGGDINANITNLSLNNNEIKTITIHLQQGQTARVPGFKIGGAAANVVWRTPNGTIPTGNDNQTDKFIFEIYKNNSGTTTVYASLANSSTNYQVNGDLTFYSDDGTTLAGSIRNDFGRLEFYNEDGTRMFYFSDTQNYIAVDRPISVSTSHYVSTTKIQQGAGAAGDITIEPGTTSGEVVLDGHVRTTDTHYVQFGSLTSTERDALTAANGMVIYNSTTNKFQGYENGSWVNLV